MGFRGSKKTAGKLYAPDHMQKLSLSLNSIFDRIEFCRFHFHESKVALDKVLHDKTDQASLISLILHFDSKVHEEFEDCKFRARAHIISCIQSLHSVSDILSQVIYYALDIKKAKTESEITLKKNYKWINSTGGFDVLSNMLGTLIYHDDYNYLCAVVNHSKHRSIVEPYFNVNLHKQGKNIQEMRFRNFEFDGKEYPSRLVETFIESEFNRESNLVINIGNEVNRIVLAKTHADKDLNSETAELPRKKIRSRTKEA